MKSKDLLSYAHMIEDNEGSDTFLRCIRYIN